MYTVQWISAAVYTYVAHIPVEIQNTSIRSENPLVHFASYSLTTNPRGPLFWCLSHRCVFPAADFYIQWCSLLKDKQFLFYISSQSKYLHSLTWKFVRISYSGNILQWKPCHLWEYRLHLANCGDILNYFYAVLINTFVRLSPRKQQNKWREIFTAYIDQL